MSESEQAIDVLVRELAVVRADLQTTGRLLQEAVLKADRLRDENAGLRKALTNCLGQPPPAE